MLRKRGPSIEACETPIIIYNHELKTESSFIFFGINLKVTSYLSIIIIISTMSVLLREKYSYSEFVWSVFSRIWTEYRQILCICPYSVRMRENMDPKKLRIRTLFTQCVVQPLLGRQSNALEKSVNNVPNAFGFSNQFCQLNECFKTLFECSKLYFIKNAFSKLWKLLFISPKKIFSLSKYPDVNGKLITELL